MALKDERLAKAEGDDSIAIVGDHAKIDYTRIDTEVKIGIQQLIVSTQLPIATQHIPIHFDPEDLLVIITSFKTHIDAVDETNFGRDFIGITIEKKTK